MVLVKIKMCAIKKVLCFNFIKIVFYLIKLFKKVYSEKMRKNKKSFSKKLINISQRLSLTRLPIKIVN